MQYFDDGGGSAREQARSKGLRKRERQGEGVRPVPGVAMAAGVVTPWAMECLLLTPALFRMPLSVFGLVYTHQVGWILWLVPVAVAALAVLPIVLGLMFARGGTRWWQVGAGGSACALLAWGAWYTRDSELGWMGLSCWRFR